MIMMYRKGSHSIFDLKYHIIWCTKYRYRVLTKEVAQRTREIIREICASNYVDILSGNVSPDNIHILVSVPPSISISKLMQYIKGKSGRKFLQEFEQLKKDTGDSMFGQEYILRLQLAILTTSKFKSILKIKVCIIKKMIFQFQMIDILLRLKSALQAYIQATCFSGS